MKLINWSKKFELLKKIEIKKTILKIRTLQHSGLNGEPYDGGTEVLVGVCALTKKVWKKEA